MADRAARIAEIVKEFYADRDATDERVAVENLARALAFTEEAVDEVRDGAAAAGERPSIVTLCGSTRFFSAFQAANYRETMTGRIVLSVGFYPHSAPEAHGEAIGISPEEKEVLDQLHLQKIDLSDEILVLNQGGYIGESTRREIAHAARTGKTIRWLEPITVALRRELTTQVTPSGVGGTDG